MTSPVDSTYSGSASQALTPSSSSSSLDSTPDGAVPHESEEEILAKIHLLHLQLSQVRGGETLEGDVADKRGPRLIVVSNRLPVTASRKSDGTWNFRVSSGGLVSALAGVKNDIPFIWVGWTGDEVPESEQESLTKRLEEEHSCVPVFLEREEGDDYYNGFCNSILWPLFHYVPLPIVSSDGERRFDFKYWNAYSKANHRFAEAIMKVYQPGDMVWVQDYHLMLLPSLLRKRIRDVTVGFFLHTPFPSSEVYRILPARNKILQGLLAADLIGFHTYDYARHFLSVCTRILGLEASPKGVTYKEHFAHVGIFPIGIDPSQFEKALQSNEVKDRIADLKTRFKGQRILLGVDRLDYIKGVPNKLMAFEALLESKPQWKGKAVLVQIAVPSRTGVEQYQKLSSQTHELVGRINGKYATVEYSPILYINQSVNFEDLCALYTVADVAVVTSIRDGMNLVSYEYVMCQKENHGVLVLSEFAGSAQSLSGAVRVNPWNIKELAVALDEALSAGARERELKHWKLYQYVTKHTAAFWAQSFVSELQKISGNVGVRTIQPQPLLSVKSDVLDELRSRSRCLLLFEYEGTLKHATGLADLAIPSTTLRRSLARLATDKKNSVYILSGRSKKVLLEWFGDLDIGLVAEHGCDFRHPRHPNWEPLVGLDDPAWRDEVIPILQYFTERTPGSYLELKDKVIAWHFRNADPQFGSWQAKELQVLLAESCMNLPVEVVSGSKYLELRPVGVNRVTAVQRIVAELPEPKVDFIFAMGSDKSDEEVFVYLNQFVRTADGSVTTLCCRVGGKSENSKADRYVPDVEGAQRALKEMAPSLSVPLLRRNRRASGHPSTGNLRRFEPSNGPVYMGQKNYPKRRSVSVDDLGPTFLASEVGTSPALAAGASGQKPPPAQQYTS
eukprot:Plantae.Rhodophyta-Hildenbrandia_rubra.ctg5735.p1 GENE.Plantae.Rhodophyta-Hildenbrandia_rubra.ctg5735~~Plantae.Rhodophyta-Hildenbrandia_rubra.ctg5735.p1  ORF type:complete len:902 (-),score=143.87 Plantae.Rhodophyta-Hildenbrandia_rubra.ctg5735:1413-4118(-)